ncbi:hypothetical protein RND71_030891 [Anisodus tanguticus]|uniref:DNA-directed RNA polymerase RBP11-like dimerisation domain-containing protein n=1 Tax=Anisodus tanguticus TaxID=243964 RepID=A0AAE1V060_9SOLA|nr:hypothetical protein RND71_030891 [Anisodus tanguticus]
MEHGSFEDHSKATFSLTDEDHTLANAIRFTLNQELVIHPFLFPFFFHYAVISANGLHISILLHSTDLIPRVTFCGYSIPHPSDARVNIRVQTTGDPAREVLNDSCQDLMLICEHVRGTFDQAILKFKTGKGLSAMDIKK